MAEPSAEAGAQNARSLTLAALLLSASVLLSRVLGFLREAVLAAQVGRGAESDAYQAAFQIPDLLNYFLAGGALSIAFVPLYQAARSRAGQPAADKLLADVLGGLGVCVSLATVALWVWAEPLLALQFPAFDPEQLALTVRLTRIVLPAQICFVLGGVIRAALMADGRFASQAAAPLLYNLGIIVGGLVGGPTLGVEGFAWGALIGAAVGALGISLLEARGRVRLGFRVALTDRAFLGYLATAAPLMLGVTLLTVDEWFGRWFGALLATGTVATLAFARRLMQLPVALVGQAVATAALPVLSRLVGEGRRGELDALVLRTLQASLGVSLIAAGALAALALPAVQLVYVRGAFHPEDALPVARALQIFCLAVPGWVLQTLAVRPFYARGDTWRPMLLGTAAVVVAVPLYRGLGPLFGANGLAAAGSIGVTANALATLVLARRLHGAPRLGALAGSAVRGSLCAVPASLAAWAVAERMGALLPGARGALLALATGGAIFAAIALPLVAWIGDSPLRHSLSGLARRVRRTSAP